MDVAVDDFVVPRCLGNLHNIWRVLLCLGGRKGLEVAVHDFDMVRIASDTKCRIAIIADRQMVKDQVGDDRTVHIVLDSDPIRNGDGLILIPGNDDGVRRGACG